MEERGGAMGPPPRKYERNELGKLLKKLEGMYEELGDKGAKCAV